MVRRPNLTARAACPPQIASNEGCGFASLKGYSHVDPRCFELSQTATLYHQLLENATVLEAAHELSADYDGLGVHWGIGHKKDRWEVGTSLRGRRGILTMHIDYLMCAAGL